MSSRAIGIVGGYGATGRTVVAELLKSTDAPLLAGGRDPAKLQALASELGAGVSTLPVDVLNATSLDEFCARCSMVVNCGGPVFRLQDRVAQAALRARCHYVDPAGMATIKERMLPQQREITELGLSFVVSAGWMPGLTELLPMYAYTVAKSKMDAVESLSLYFSDSGEWSENALRDGAWLIHKTGLVRPGYFRKGQWTQASMSEASCKVDLGIGTGMRRFSLFAFAGTKRAWTTAGRL